MKKIIWVSALLAVFSILRMAPAEAVIIGFEPDIQAFEVGDSFDVNVLVSDLPADEIVSTFDLTVAFNSSVLSATGVNFGGFLDDAVFPSIQNFDISIAGEVNFFEISFLLDDELVLLQPDDSFLLATLSFDALTVGISPLNFLEGTVPGVPGLDVKGRADVNDIPLLLPNLSGGVGEVTVSSVATVPEPGTFILLAIGLWVVACCRCRSKTYGDRIVG